MEKKTNYDWDYDYDSKNYELENKYFDIFVKVAMGASISIIISTIISTLGIISTPIFLLIAVITLPSVFIAATIFKNNSDKRFKRDMYEAGMLGKYMQEALTKEHKVDEKTAYFIHEIKECDIEMNMDNLLNINQLIYLINQSYYEKIVNKSLKLSRHELVIKLLEQVKLYIENANSTLDSTFDYQDAEKIINGCFFIPDEVKNEILHDFYKARISTGNRTSFIIEPIDDSFKRQSMEEYLSSKEYILSCFDINDLLSYELLMRIYKNTEMNPYKDAFLVDWDLPAIRDCMSLIVRRFGLIIEKRGNELYHYEMAATFFYNLCAYASVNKVSHVGIREIVNTFKNWDYFDHNLKVDIIDAIFEEFNLDYSMHPYRQNKKNKEVGKIYKFFSNKENKK